MKKGFLFCILFTSFEGKVKQSTAAKRALLDGNGSAACFWSSWSGGLSRETLVKQTRAVQAEEGWYRAMSTLRPFNQGGTFSMKEMPKAYDHS
ncbi:MAG: hypothetical protein PUG97_02120, partial [bacterium]|nr:hypothetical protein [bacterium]